MDLQLGKPTTQLPEHAVALECDYGVWNYAGRKIALIHCDCMFNIYTHSKIDPCEPVLIMIVVLLYFQAT